MSILIVSDSLDVVVDEVIDWIQYFGHQTQRLCFDELIYKFSISWKNTNDYSNLFLADCDNLIKSAWFRMDTSNDYHNSHLLNYVDHPSLIEIQKFLRNEIINAKNLLLNSYMSNIKWLSGYDSIKLNKFKVLTQASRIGFNIPESIITNNKIDVVNFVKENKIDCLILKSIGENICLMTKDNKNIYQPIIELSLNDVIKNIPDKFFPTLFQRKIEKECELRVTYLNRKFYTACIKSSFLDYREDIENAIIMAYKLPLEIEYKICLLMDFFNLNFGCIDLLKDKNENFYLLEINPNGQFGMISKMLNFNIEKDVARFLCEN